jgi:response regulator RpfG family c-di-GMP phosphodiesterase
VNDIRGQHRLTVLCVDDDPNVLEGLSLHLRRRFEVATATSAERALEWLEEGHPVAIILSDLRMPEMDGAAFLARSRALRPDAIRILLTGQAELEAAVRAINDGRIFRFLTKPCAPQELLGVLAGAEEQYRLVTNERVLLEETLHGAIKCLTEVLALSSPLCFGRAERIKRTATELSAALGYHGRWQVEVAAMCSQLGFAALPVEVVEKVYYSTPLTPDEQKMVARVPSITEQLLGNLPRMETVRGILSQHARSYRRTLTDTPSELRGELVERGAQILKVAIDYDTLEGAGDSPALAIGTLRSRADRYDPEVVAALADLRRTGRGEEVREVSIAALRPGMVIAADVKANSGTLLLARGHEVTTGLLERARHFRPGTVREPVRVYIRRPTVGTVVPVS